MSESLLTTAFVGMGSNVGDRLASLQLAVSGLSEFEGVELEAVSPVYETEAHVRTDQDSQQDHLNAVMQIRTSLPAADFLSQLQGLEFKAGRNPETPSWSPRELDLDLLLYGDALFELEDLIIPHPRMAERRFVLQPLADLVHNLVIPGADGATVSDLLKRCPDTKRVERTELRLDVDPRPRQ